MPISEFVRARVLCRMSVVEGAAAEAVESNEKRRAAGVDISLLRRYLQSLRPCSSLCSAQLANDAAQARIGPGSAIHDCRHQARRHSTVARRRKEACPTDPCLRTVSVPATVSASHIAHIARPCANKPAFYARVIAVQRSEPKKTHRHRHACAVTDAVYRLPWNSPNAVLSVGITTERQRALARRRIHIETQDVRKVSRRAGLAAQRPRRESRNQPITGS